MRSVSSWIVVSVVAWMPAAALAQGTTTGPQAATRPGVSPRDAEKVRAWGLANGWKEVAPRATTQQQDEQSAARGTAAGEVGGSQPYELTRFDREHGLLMLAPDRNRFRPRDQWPTRAETEGLIRLAGFVGEHEGAPVAAYAIDDLGPVEISVTDLKSDKGEVVPACDVRITEVIYAPLSLRNTRQKENRFQMWPMWLVPVIPEPLPAGRGEPPG